MKQTLSRKQLTPKEAEKRMANLWQEMFMHEDNIHCAVPKLGKPLEHIDIFILGTDKLKNYEEFIKLSQKRMEQIRWKIYEDYARFGDPHKARMMVG